MDQMDMRAFVWFILLGWLAMSCVPTQKVNLFQDQTIEEEYPPTDSITQIYTNTPTPIQLQSGDFISIKIGSLTPSEYDFVKEYQARLGVLGQQIERTRNIQVGMQAQGGGGGSQGVDNPQLQQLYGFQLDGEGHVELPYIGKVLLEGNTVDQAASIIRDSLLAHFRSPMVRVEMLNFNFSVVGEITSPGRYTSYTQDLTIMDAILMANGFTEFSVRERVKIVRTRNGVQEVSYVNLLDERVLGSPYYYLQPGDLIVVQQLKAKATRQYTLPNTNFIIGLTSTGLTLWLLIDRIANQN